MFWIIKLSDNTGANNVTHTITRSCWSSADVPNCTTYRGWLGALFSYIADGIGLSDTDTSNCVISIGWLGAWYASGTNSIILLGTSTLISVIAVG